MTREGRKINFSMNTKKLLIAKRLRIILVFLLAAIVVGVGVYLYSSGKNPKYIDRSVPILPYTNEAGITYEVFAVANDLFPEKSYGPGGVYIASLIDYVDVILDYQFKGDKPAELSGKYSVTADIEGFVTDEKGIITIWKKQYVLLPETKFKIEDRSMSIQKKLAIRPADYNTFLDSVKSKLKFGYNVKLVLKWNVLTDIRSSEGSKNEMITAFMEFPLSKDYFEITGQLTQENKGAVEKTEKVISPVFIRIRTTCWITWAIGIILLIFLGAFTKPYTIDSPLQKKLRQVFKNHGSRMVGMGSETTINTNDIIEISSMDDLVKIADDVGRPIMYRKSCNPEEIFYFYVIEENNIYVFDIRKVITYPQVNNSTDTCMPG